MQTQKERVKNSLFLAYFCSFASLAQDKTKVSRTILCVAKITQDETKRSNLQKEAKREDLDHM